MFFVGARERSGRLRRAQAALGRYVVAASLGGVVVDLVTLSGCYDVALRGFGLLLGPSRSRGLLRRTTGRERCRHHR